MSIAGLVLTFMFSNNKPKSFHCDYGIFLWYQPNNYVIPEKKYPSSPIIEENAPLSD